MEKLQIQEKALLDMAGRSGIGVAMEPTDAGLSRWRMVISYRGKRFVLYNWRGDERTWANLTTAAKYLRNELGALGIKKFEVWIE